MKEEILKRIDALAEKLGVAASHIYSVYVHQAQINGIQELTWAAFWLAIAVLTAVVSIKNFKKSQVVVLSEYGEERRTDQEKRRDALFLCVLFSFATGLLLFGFVSELSSAYTSFLNPEYFAIHQITEDIRGQ